MATAAELLATSSKTVDEILIADLNTRLISIPATIRNLGVESDDDVKRLHFNIPRYYGETDLSEFDIRINFENARGIGDVYPVDDLTIVDDETLSFSWLVDRHAFQFKGDVVFNICMKKFDKNGVVVKELNTTMATLPVLEGLETEEAVVDNNPSAFDTILFRLYAVEAATGNGQNGYYSVIRVNEYDYGVLFTIVNQDGSTVALVKHGKDGFSPVKGVDYWTETDQAEVKDELKAFIDNWAPKIVPVTLPSTGWVNNSQIVTVTGVVLDSLIIPAPEPSDENYALYNDAAIRCVDQDVNSLTFVCDSPPSDDVVVNVAILYNTEAIANTGGLTVIDDGEGNVTIV